MTDPPIWLGFGKALLAGGLAYIGMLLAQAVHGRAKHLTRHHLETALAAALGAVIAVMVITSYAGFPGSALALGAIVLVYLGVVRLVPEPTSAALEAVDLSEDEVVQGLRAMGVERNEQVAALVLEEAGILRLFFADACPPAFWKRNSKSPSRGRRREEA